jgi:hypothetical protein
VYTKAFAERVEIYCDDELVKEYRRSYRENEEVMEWQTYLPLLLKKPGATPNTRFFDQLPRLWQAHLKAVQGQDRRDALKLLAQIVEDGNEGVCDTVLELAGECGASDIESLRQCYLFVSEPERHPNPLEIDSPKLNFSPDLAVYDLLSGRCS